MATIKTSVSEGGEGGGGVGGGGGGEDSDSGGDLGDKNQGGSSSRSRQKKFLKAFKQLPPEEVVLQSKCIGIFYTVNFYNKFHGYFWKSIVSVLKKVIRCQDVSQEAKKLGSFVYEAWLFS